MWVVYGFIAIVIFNLLLDKTTRPLTLSLMLFLALATGITLMVLSVWS